MIACASPSLKNAEESLNCLRYANRAKNIQNLAVVNVDPHSKLVNVLRGQVEALAWRQSGHRRVQGVLLGGHERG